MPHDPPRTDYEKIARLYDVDRAHWVVRPDKVLQSLIAKAPSTITVLDVACGTGIYLSAQCDHFAGASVRWLGVDASRQMLTSAAAKGSGVALIEARAEGLPIRTGSIDYVYSSFAFHHFSDKELALDEIARVLRTGGQLRVRNMDPWGQRAWWLYTHFEGTWETDQRRFWPVPKLQAEVERRGFDVEAEVEIEETTRTGADILAEAERRVISQLAILDDAAFSSGIERLRAKPPDDDVPYVRARLTLTARKR